MYVGYISIYMFVGYICICWVLYNILWHMYLTLLTRATELALATYMHVFNIYFPSEEDVYIIWFSFCYVSKYISGEVLSVYRNYGDVRSSCLWSIWFNLVYVIPRLLWSISVYASWINMTVSVNLFLRVFFYSI